MKQLIVLGVSGSIAAVRSFDLCRELRRKGFDVQVVLSGAGREIITEQTMEFASGRKVISSLSGAIEHVKFMGKRGKASLLLIAPATANTISKIALGIDDTPITTFATVAIGSGKPVLLAPAMHKPMYEHPIVAQNLQKLESRGVKIISPLEEEGKAKLASINEIIFEVERALSGSSLEGKKILIASGSFHEPIDDVRSISNLSSGKMGNAIAISCRKEKAQVKLIGNGEVAQFIDFEQSATASDLEKKVLSELAGGYDYFFCPAAIPDFSIAKHSGKMNSGKALKIELKPRAKLLKKVKGKFPELKIIAFKALFGAKKREIESNAKHMLKDGYFAVCANDLESNPAGSEKSEIFFASRKKSKWIKGEKGKIAEQIVKLV